MHHGLGHAPMPSIRPQSETNAQCPRLCQTSALLQSQRFRMKRFGASCNFCFPHGATPTRALFIRFYPLTRRLVPSGRPQPINRANASGWKVHDKPLAGYATWDDDLKVRFAVLAAFLLASAFPQTGHAQGPPPGQPHIQIPVPGIAGVGVGPPPPQEREYRG